MNLGLKTMEYLRADHQIIVGRILDEYCTDFGCSEKAVINPSTQWAKNHKRISSSQMNLVKKKTILKKYIPESRGFESDVIVKWLSANNINKGQIRREVALCSPKYPFISCRIDAIMCIKNKIVGVEFKGLLKNVDFDLNRVFFDNCPVMMQVVTYSIVFGGIDVYLVFACKNKKDIQIKTKLFKWEEIQKTRRNFNYAAAGSISISFTTNIFLWKLTGRFKKDGKVFFNSKEIKNLKDKYLKKILVKEEIKDKNEKKNKIKKIKKIKNLKNKNEKNQNKKMKKTNIKLLGESWLTFLENLIKEVSSRQRKALSKHSGQNIILPKIDSFDDDFFDFKADF